MCKCPEVAEEIWNWKRSFLVIEDNFKNILRTFEISREFLQFVNPTKVAGKFTEVRLTLGKMMNRFQI